MFVGVGKGDRGHKVITLEGEAKGPASSRKDLIVRTVLRISGRDRHTLEMFHRGEGRNEKTMEIIYTRQ